MKIACSQPYMRLYVPAQRLPGQQNSSVTNQNQHLLSRIAGGQELGRLELIVDNRSILSLTKLRYVIREDLSD